VKIAHRVTLTFTFAVLVMVAAYAYVEIGDESHDLRASLESKLSLAATESLAVVRDLDPSIPRVAPAQLAGELGLPAELDVRWVSLDPGQEAPHNGERDGRMYAYRGFVDRAGRPAALEVSQATDTIEADLHEATEFTLGLAALILAAATLYTMTLGSRIIGRPIEELVERFRRVGSGDLTATPPTQPRRDEFGRLGRELDLMIERLAESRATTLREQEARLAAQEQVRHSDRLATVGRLASGLAHELGTPLNVISGYAKMIATGQDTGDDAQSGAKIISEQTARVTAIVRQLLDFARRGTPKLAATDVRAVIARAMGMIGILADKRSVLLAYREPASAIMADVDEARFEQVVVNLLVNAIHASPSNAGAKVELELAPLAGKHELRLDVIDHGTGITPEQLERVFEPFFTTKPVGEGTGLGLAVSHGIVEEHGGRIEVQSEVGRGSRFSVYLPVT
jgi:signal transduction histidine kinase